MKTVTPPPRLLIMAGGTGGHVFPALTIAHVLQAKGWRIQWLGSPRGLEQSLVPEAGFSLYTVSVQGLRRKGLWGWLMAPVTLTFALLQSIRVLLRFQPNLVLGMGGFVTGPGGLAAWLLRYPLIIHEQNSRAGLTNRWLSRLATRVLAGFPRSFDPQTPVVVTGNPIRPSLLSLPTPRERFLNRTGPLRLLVLGGSRGAQALNTLVVDFLARLPPDQRPEIWHQTGADRATETKAAYAQHQLTARVVPFLADMAAAYAWADLVLCRAGALTVSELTVVGLGSLLVPYPFAVDDHQTHNARFLTEQAAATLLPQSTLCASQLAQRWQTYAPDRGFLLRQAEAAYAIGQRNATEQVVAHCEEIGHRLLPLG